MQLTKLAVATLIAAAFVATPAVAQESPTLKKIKDVGARLKVPSDAH